VEYRVYGITRNQKVPADQLMDGDVESSAAVDGGSGSPQGANPHINVTGYPYPLGLIASVATGVFGGTASLFSAVMRT